MAWLDGQEVHDAQAAVSDRLVQIALVALALLSLYGAFGGPVSVPASQSSKVAHERDGTTAYSCRTVRWCSKPSPAGTNERFMVLANKSVG